MEGRLEQPTKHANTPANTLCVASMQRCSALPIYTLRATFSTACRLPTGTRDAAQPTRRQQPPTARAVKRTTDKLLRKLGPQAAAVSMLLLIVLLNRGERSERSELSMSRDSTENIALPGQPVVLVAAR